MRTRNNQNAKFWPQCEYVVRQHGTKRYRIGLAIRERVDLERRASHETIES